MSYYSSRILPTEKISGSDSVFAIYNYLLYVLLAQKKLAVVKVFFIHHSPPTTYYHPWLFTENPYGVLTVEFLLLNTSING